MDSKQITADFKVTANIDGDSSIIIPQDKKFRNENDQDCINRSKNKNEKTRGKNDQTKVNREKINWQTPNTIEWKISCYQI